MCSLCYQTNFQKKSTQNHPRKSKDQTLPVGSRESFTWIILKTILCLVLDFQGHPLQPRSRFFLRKKKRGAQKTGGFPSPVPYMTLHLANVSPDRLPTAHTCGLQLDLYLGLLLKHEIAGSWEEKNTKPGETVFHVPGFMYGIFTYICLNMYGK